MHIVEVDLSTMKSSRRGETAEGVAKQQKALRKSRRRGETAEQWRNLGYDEKTTFSCGGSTGEKRVKSHAVIKKNIENMLKSRVITKI
jgi:hypothetical protein